MDMIKIHYIKFQKVSKNIFKINISLSLHIFLIDSMLTVCMLYYKSKMCLHMAFT